MKRTESSGSFSEMKNKKHTGQQNKEKDEQSSRVNREAVIKGSDTSLPGYMKPTVSSNMMERAQKTSSKAEKLPNKKSLGSSLHPKTNVTSQTCSSTLKNSKLLKQLGLMEGGKELKGIKHVCRYTHCTLHGHHMHHSPRKDLSSAGRKIFRNQKSIALKRLSSSRKKGLDRGKRKIGTGTKNDDIASTASTTSCLTKAQDRELYTRTHEEPSDTDESNRNTNATSWTYCSDTNSRIGFGESTTDNYWNMSSEENMDTEGNLSVSDVDTMGRYIERVKCQNQDKYFEEDSSNNLLQDDNEWSSDPWLRGSKSKTMVEVAQNETTRLESHRPDMHLGEETSKFLSRGTINSVAPGFVPSKLRTLTSVEGSKRLGPGKIHQGGYLRNNAENTSDNKFKTKEVWVHNVDSESECEPVDETPKAVHLQNSRLSVLDKKSDLHQQKPVGGFDDRKGSMISSNDLVCRMDSLSGNGVTTEATETNGTKPDFHKHALILNSNEAEEIELRDHCSTHAESERVQKKLLSYEKQQIPQTAKKENNYVTNKIKGSSKESAIQTSDQKEEKDVQEMDEKGNIRKPQTKLGKSEASATICGLLSKEENPVENIAETAERDKSTEYEEDGYGGKAGIFSQYKSKGEDTFLGRVCSESQSALKENELSETTDIQTENLISGGKNATAESANRPLNCAGKPLVAVQQHKPDQHVSDVSMDSCGMKPVEDVESQKYMPSSTDDIFCKTAYSKSLSNNYFEKTNADGLPEPESPLACAISSGNDRKYVHDAFGDKEFEMDVNPAAFQNNSEPKFENDVPKHSRPQESAFLDLPHSDETVQKIEVEDDNKAELKSKDSTQHTVVTTFDDPRDTYSLENPRWLENKAEEFEEYTVREANKKNATERSRTSVEENKFSSFSSNGSKITKVHARDQNLESSNVDCKEIYLQEERSISSINKMPSSFAVSNYESDKTISHKQVEISDSTVKDLPHHAEKIVNAQTAGIANSFEGSASNNLKMFTDTGESRDKLKNCLADTTKVENEHNANDATHSLLENQMQDHILYADRMTEQGNRETELNIKHSSNDEAKKISHLQHVNAAMERYEEKNSSDNKPEALKEKIAGDKILSNQDHTEEIKRGCENDVISDISKLEVQNPNLSSSGNSAETSEESKIKTKTDTTDHDDETTDSCFLNDALIISKGQSDTYLQNNGEGNYQPKPSKGCSPTSPHPIPPINQKSESLGPDHNNTTCSTEKKLGSSALFGNEEYAEILQENSKGRELKSGVSGPAVSEIDVEKAKDEGFDSIPCYAGNTSNITTLQAPTTTRSSPNIESNVQGELEDTKNIEFEDKEDETSDTATRDENRKYPLIVIEVKSINNAKVEKNLFQMEPPNQASHATAEKIDSENDSSETAKFEISTSDHGGKKGKFRLHNLVSSEESHELEAALSKGFQQANYEEMEDKEHEPVKAIDKDKNTEASLVDAMETMNDVQVETNLSKIKTPSHAPLKTVEKHIEKEEAETKTEISRFNHVKKELSLSFNDKRNDDEEHSCSLNNTNNSDENQPGTKAPSAATAGNTSDTMTTYTSSIHPPSLIPELQEEEFLKNHEDLVGSPSQANKIVTKVEDITCLDESHAKPEAHGLLTNNRGEISDTTITRQEQEKASQSELICKSKDEDSLKGFFQVTCAQSSAEKKITGIIDAEKENGIHSNNSKEYATPASPGETSKKTIASPTHSSGHISEEHGSYAQEKGTPDQINEIISSLEGSQKFDENNTDECMEPNLAANQGETYGTRSKQQELTSNSGLLSEPYEEEPLGRHSREMGSPRNKGKSFNTKEINESDLEFNGLKSLKTHGTQEKKKNNIGSAYGKSCPSNATNKSNDHQSNRTKECGLVANQGEAANTVTTSISQANVPQPKSRSCEEESDRECVDDIHSPYSSDEIKIKLEEYQPDDSETVYQGERVDADILQVPRTNASRLVSESDEREFSEMDDQSVDTPNSRNKIFSSLVIFDLENDFLFEEPGEVDGSKIEDAFTHDTNEMNADDNETADEEPVYDSFSPEACQDMVANNDNLYYLQGSNVKGRNTNNQEDVSNSVRIKISDHSPKITVTDIAEEDDSLGKVKIGRVDSTCKETSPDAFYSEVDSDAFSVQQIKKSEAGQLTHSPEHKTNVTKGHEGQIRKHNNRNFRSESCKGLSDKYSHGDDDTAHHLRNFRSASSKGLSNKYSHRDDDTVHHFKNEINKINKLCRSLSHILDTNKGPQSRESLMGCKQGRNDASSSKNSISRLSSLRFESKAKFGSTESSEPKGPLSGVLKKNAGPHIQEPPRGCIQASYNATNRSNSFQQMSPSQFENNTIIVSKESSVTSTASPLLDRADLEEKEKRNAESGTTNVRSDFVESEAIDSLITSNKHLNHNGPAGDNGQSQNNVDDMNSTGKVESTKREVVHNMAEDDEMDTELQTEIDTSPIKSSSLQDDIQSTCSNYQSETCYGDDMDNELVEDAIKSFSNREAEKCTHRNENSGSLTDTSQMANDSGPIEGETYRTTAFEHYGKIVYITSVEIDSDQLHPETIKKLKATSSMKKSRLSENSGKQKASDQKIPELLPAEPDPEAEWIDLRHQEIETKDSERWMIDYALRQIISKLIPVRKKKVALLIEAFEAVKTYMNRTI